MQNDERIFSKALFESLSRYKGCVHIPLKEMTLPQIGANAISNFTQTKINDRYQNEYTYSVGSVENDGVNLTVTFQVLSTFMNGEPVYAGYTDSKDGEYAVVIQFQNANQFCDFGTLSMESNDSKIQIVKKIIENCDVKVYSDDPSFYYQGFWEDLDQVNMSLYPFPGPKGDGKWQAFHFVSGGLKNPMVRVTKHIGQIALEYSKFINNIARAI